MRGFDVPKRQGNYTTSGPAIFQFAFHLLAGLELKLTGGIRLFGAVRYDTVSDVQQNKVYGDFD